jgi:hypothetical protein
MAAQANVTGRRVGVTGAPPSVERAAYSISEFCAAHRISQSMYFKIRNAGLGPREARALNKVIITLQSADDWRRERETAPLV